MHKKDMKHINWQFKFFIFWFVAFIASAVISMATHHEFAINITMALLILMGSVMVITTGNDAVLSLLSKKWPTTEFSILDSRVSRSMSQGAGVSYKAYFELGYKVLGRSYELSCNSFNIPIHSTEEEAERYIEDVRKGKYGKNVHYNPASPEQAYVKPGLKLQHVLAILFGLGFVLVPIGIMLGYINA